MYTGVVFTENHHRQDLEDSAMRPYLAELGDGRVEVLIQYQAYSSIKTGL